MNMLSFLPTTNAKGKLMNTLINKNKPSPKHLLRTVTPADYPKLLQLWEASVRATHSFLTTSAIQELIPVVEEALPMLEVWVAHANQDTQPLGFMGLSAHKIEALFISPTNLRQGYGAFLLEQARELKGRLNVDVNEQNLEAVRFYLTNGFEVIGRSPVDSLGNPYPLLHLQDY